MKHNTYQAAIFDMDGTVLDTLQDLGDALNYALHSTGHTYTVTRADTALFFGSGVKVAVQRALAAEAGFDRDQILRIGTEEEVLPDTATDEEVAKLQEAYRPYYNAHSAEKTAEYQGISDLLSKLREAGVRTAVVSNKPHSAVVPLTERYFPDRFDYSLGEQEGIKRKPDADMVLYALNKLEVSPEHAVYIGDTEIDLETARNAGMDCLAVTWGFRDEDYLRGCGAKTIIHRVDDLYDAICGGDR